MWPGKRRWWIWFRLFSWLCWEVKEEEVVDDDARFCDVGEWMETCRS